MAELTPQTSVLIVDDSKQYALVLQKMLSFAFGYKDITHIESPEEAIKHLDENPNKYGLFFIDFRFPGGTTGGELLEQMSAKKLLDGKIAFLITSEPSSDNVKQAVKAGAVGIVAKPFDREQLGKQLEKAKRLAETSEVESF